MTMSRILLIDNDPRLTRGLRRRLEAEGYVVRTARDGLAGMRLAEAGGHDLILLDAAAPVLNGYELLERLRAGGDTTPVILLASQGTEQDRIRGLRLGAADFVVRPVGHGELLARIRTRTGAARREAVLNGALSGDSLSNLVDKALELTRAERGLVLVRNGSPKLRIAVARDADGKALPGDVKYSTTVARHVMESGNAEVLIDPADADPTGEGSVIDLRLRQVLCAPLESGGQCVGVLYADSRAHSSGFTQADLDVFQSLARQCSKVMAKRRMEDALREARDLQRALVPARPRSGPHLQVAGLSRPLEEAGGDYLDYIRLGKHRLAIAVGDVAGHGVGAALMMTAARSLLRAFLPREPDPAAALFQLNRSLWRDMPRGSFMSMFVVEVDTDSGRLRYASAGHNAALVLRAKTGEFEELCATGAALGVVEKGVYCLADTAPLRPGDMLLVYTDGFTETVGNDHELFGLERLKRTAAGLSKRTAPEVVSGVVGAVSRFAGRRGPDDDCSLVVVKGT